MTVKLTNSQFIARANTIHNFVYDYSQVAYKNNATKVQIICPHHGPFNQRPSDHLRGQGCPICKKDKIAAANRLTHDDFILRCKVLHDGKYSYRHVTYYNNTTPVKIECPIHGVFEQTPAVHLRGGGCKLCSDERNRSNKGGYSSDFFDIHPDMKEHPGLLYLVKLTSSSETLIKIGITTKSTVHERFRSVNTFYGYAINVIKTINTTLYKAFLTEQNIIHKFAEFQIFPKKRFNGFTECFSWTTELESEITTTLEGMV